MSYAVALLALLNIAFVGLLPRIFFRQDGRYNLKWFLTAAPFIVNPIFIGLTAYGSLEPVVVGLPYERVLREAASVPFFAASIALIAFTIGVHRVPLALWHQDNDAPKSIVTHGPYAWVRHPFYTSFLIALFGVVVACPQVGTLGCFLYGVVVLSLTARREERRLSASDFGAEYREYMKEVGRLLPFLGKAAS